MSFRDQNIKALGDSATETAGELSKATTLHISFGNQMVHLSPRRKFGILPHHDWPPGGSIENLSRIVTGRGWLGALSTYRAGGCVRG